MSQAVPGSLFRVRGAESQDAEAIAAVAAASPGAAPWSAGQFEVAAGGEFQGYVVEHGGRVVGFIFARHAADEAEILNLAVSPEQRGMGIGSRLIEHALDRAKDRGAVRAYLEVRAANQPAIALYKRSGFAEIGRRVGYYSDPVEDALVLSRNLL